MVLKLSNRNSLEQLALKGLNHRRKLNSWHFHCNLVCHNHLHCSNKSCMPCVRRPTGDRRQLPYKRCVDSRCWANDQVPTKILQRVDTRRFQLKRDRSAGDWCHCEIGFSPPDCSQPGGGGSDHSNPASAYTTAATTSTSRLTARTTSTLSPTTSYSTVTTTVAPVGPTGAYILTPSTPAVPYCCCSKGSAPYWSNPPVLIFDTRALWRSGLSARAPEC